MRLSKYTDPSQYEFFNMNNGNILIKTGRGFKIINNTLKVTLRDP